MRKQPGIQDLSKHLFWDLDLRKLDEQKNKTIIIERVFTRGDIDDLKILFQLYNIEVIKQEIVKAGFLDKKTLNWASLFLNIPKTKFKCYTKIQSRKVHWNF
ncbi:MAG TPA: hypothetical protein VJ896_11270 [Bacteroidales bacterium]|nr:hypothetical protein [Bacteroidales bacterium]